MDPDDGEDAFRVLSFRFVSVRLPFFLPNYTANMRLVYTQSRPYIICQHAIHIEKEKEANNI